MKMKKFLTALLALCIIFSFAVPMAYAADQSIAISVTDGNAQNIYSSDDAVGFTVVYTNSSPTALTGLTATVELINDTLGEVIKTTTDTVDIEAAARTTKEYTELLNSRSFGNLTLGVTLKNGGTTLATSSLSFTRVHNDGTLNYGLGYNSNHGFEWKDPTWTNETAEMIINACKKAGVGYVRHGIEWAQIETTKGQNSLPDDAVAFYKQLTDAGLKVVVNLFYGNNLYEGTNTSYMPVTDDGRKAFAAFAGKVAEQLNGMVFDYSVWNEPDLSYANSNNATGADYAALVKEASAAIKNVNSSNNVIGMVTSGGFGNSYATAAKAAGALDSMDTVASNYYFNGADPDVDGTTFDELVSKGTSLVGDEKLWFTEIGINSADVTDDEATVRFAKLPIINANNGNISTMIYYALMDRAGGVDGVEATLGHITKDGVAKNRYISTAFANGLVTNVTSNGMTSNKIQTGTSWGGIVKKYSYVSDYRFTAADGGKVAAIWTTEQDGDDPTYTVSFTAEDGKELFVYDMYGNLKTHTTANSVSLTSSNEPQYVLYAVPDSDTGAGDDVEIEIAETCSITAENGTVSVSGTTNDKYVSVYAFADGKTMLESVAMAQFTVADDGTFSGTIKVPEEDIYAVKVSASVTSENLLSTQKLTALFDFYADGVKLGSLAELKAAASANSKIEAEVLNDTDDILGMIAVYNGNSFSSMIMDDDNNSTVVLDGIDMTADSHIKMFLWNSFKDITPYIEPITLK